MKKSLRLLVLVCMVVACMAATATAKPFSGDWVFHGPSKPWVQIFNH